MADDAIAEHRFDNPEDLLAALRPGNTLWKPDPGSWAFRGHADSNWLLIPSGNRRSALKRYFATKYSRDDSVYVLPEAADLGALLEQFVLALDRAGHPVPGVGRFNKAEIVAKVIGGRSDAHTHELVALAQHYGLPTYMLDWTRHATVAAYFAASDTADIAGDGKGEIEVWALNTSVVTARTHNPYGLIDGIPIGLDVSSPLRSGNPNLHAQGGVFTYTSYQHESIGLRPADEVVRATAERNPWWARPVMHRFRLPQRQAGRLLWLLAFEPVTGGALFPGLGGVVRDVRDAFRYR